MNRSWTPKNPDYATLVREAFAVEPPMVLIGATMVKVEPGFVEIHLPVRQDLMTSYAQVVHGGVLAMIADAAMAQAAYTLAAPNAVGVTLEYKINLLAPAVGERIIARGSVVKPGQNTTVAQAELFSVDAAGKEKLVAVALGTLMALT
jgi:uncharacterized protein (TIGR00369 family)